jgi:hypothetical protein
VYSIRLALVWGRAGSEGGVKDSTKKAVKAQLLALPGCCHFRPPANSRGSFEGTQNIGSHCNYAAWVKEVLGW